MRTQKLLALSLMVVGALALSASRASAVPILQLYLEGGTYDAGTESWVVDGATDPLRLWAIGNVGGPGGKGTIYDVKLSIAYANGATPTIAITPSTTGNYGNFDDPSAPSAPVFNKTVTDGSVPQLGDGSDLASHGEYGAGTDWTEYALGDFTLQDSPVADFITSFPSIATNAALKGQINVYEISVTGYTGNLHFDLYDHVGSATKAMYKFAPFSHDATGCCGTEVPEPGTVSMFGSALAAMAGAFAVRRRRTA